MLAKMIDKIVSLKETKIFEIDGQTYADASLTRIPLCTSTALTASASAASIASAS